MPPAEFRCIQMPTMRARHWVLSGVSALFVSGLVAAGCGGTDETPPAQDAGQDTSVQDTAPPKDTAPEITDTAKPCVSDADLNTLNPPDAALADGATSVGICIGCAKAACGPQFRDCNNDCECKNAIASVFQCVAAGGTLAACAAPLISGGTVPQVAQNLGLCVYTGCAKECTGSGGRDAGGDGASDAPADG
jgi:hypothetical protein